jgi:putative glutamine amidotransferase
LKPLIAVLLGEVIGDDIRVSYHFAQTIVFAGGTPVHLTPQSIGKQLTAVQPDGLILPGGDFPFVDDYYVDESFYGGRAGDRFAAYETMIEYSIANGRPILGVCAGMQVLAGYLGGKITSNISGHRKIGSEYAHSVHIVQESLLWKITGGADMNVNSRHNEAVDSRNNTGIFKITAMSGDGVIEAIEPANPWADFILGVQWHPENLAAKDKHQRAIFDAFVKAAAKIK